MDLSLELKPKVGKNKKGANGNKFTFGSGEVDENGDPVLTLQECLERFTTPEKLGVNEYNCSKCSGSTQQEATKQLTVKRLPPVLCIQLKVILPSTAISPLPHFPVITYSLTPFPYSVLNILVPAPPKSIPKFASLRSWT